MHNALARRFAQVAHQSNTLDGRRPRLGRHCRVRRGGPCVALSPPMTRGSGESRYTFTRCIQVTRAEILEAARSRDACSDLLTHFSSISRPNSGAPLLLLLFARLATVEGAWLEGDLQIVLTAVGEGTFCEVATSLCLGMAERVFPRIRLEAPLSEFAGAADRVPRMIWPLTLERGAGRLVLRASKAVRTTMLPPVSEDVSAVKIAPMGLPADLVASVGIRLSS